MKSGYSMRSQRTGRCARFADQLPAKSGNWRRDSTPARGPGSRQRGQLAMANGPGSRAPGARTRAPGARPTDQGSSCSSWDQLQAINAISANQSPAGAGSREIVRQLSPIDQAPGAQLQPANGPRPAGHEPRTTNHEPRTRRTGSGIGTPGQPVRRQGRKTWRLV